VKSPASAGRLKIRGVHWKNALRLAARTPAAARNFLFLIVTRHLIAPTLCVVALCVPGYFQPSRGAGLVGAGSACPVRFVTARRSAIPLACNLTGVGLNGEQPEQAIDDPGEVVTRKR